MPRGVLDTNIVFLAEPAAGTFPVNPTAISTTYVFDVLDHDEITIFLADREGIHIEDGIVTFDVDADDGFADLDLAANIEITEIDDVIQPAGTQQITVQVMGN